MKELGWGRKRLINKIIMDNWQINSPEKMKFKYQEMLFLIQELLTEEGKPYMELGTTPSGFTIFRHFVKHLLYRNIANYDSMVLVTSEKGCIFGDALLECPRNLTKYPKGIPLKELAGKGPLWVYSFNTKTKKLEVKRSDGVEFVKEDYVWEIELTNGWKIECTNNHPFLLMDGTYKQLKDLFWIDKMGSNKKYEYTRIAKNNKWVYTDRLRVMFRPDEVIKNDFIKIDYSKIKWKKGDNAYKHSMMEHRFIAEQFYGNIEGKLVHHKNENHSDNRPENIEVVNRSEHYFRHGMNLHQFRKDNKYCYYNGYSSKKKKRVKVKTEAFVKQCSEKRIAYFTNPYNLVDIEKFGEKRKQINPIRSSCQTGGIIKSIRYIGKKSVFDVTNVQDNHNFIVNGFVVSNTGKSSAAIMLAREWCKMIGIRFNPKRHIAYNNADVMNKIDLLKKFEPLICVSGGSRIYIEQNGIEKSKRIKDLVDMKNYKVLSYNVKDDKFEYQKPSVGAVFNKQDTVYEVELENGVKISATKEHKFLTKNGYKMLKDLTEQDEIVLNSKKCIVCGTEFFPHSLRYVLCSEKCTALFSANRRKYRLNETKKWYRNYHKRKIQTDILYRLKHNINTRMMRYVDIKTGKQENRTEKIIGCTVSQLKEYLENQFKDGMTWENYGGSNAERWSIDHIIPLSKFDLTNKEEIKKCFHYTNIQPLWNNLNSAKGRWNK